MNQMKVGIASGDWIHPLKSGQEHPHWGGSGWARLGQYADLLPFQVTVGVLTWIKDHFYIVDLDNAKHDVDVVYIQRLMHAGLKDHIMQARAYGQKVINDMDDWYWGLSTDNQAYWVNHPNNNTNENINHYKFILNNSDMVTVSTPYLRDRLSAFVRCPMVVVPNYVDVARFTTYEHKDTDTPTVGWVGSTGHRSGDIETIAGWLRPMAERGEVLLYHGGDHISNPSYASKLKIDPSFVRTKPLVKSQDYPSLMDMDIGVIPLSNIPFNHAKSDIKGLEYASAGIPFVAQSVSSYADLKAELGIGLTAGKSYDWIRHIKKLCDYTYRCELAEHGLEQVKKRDISIGVTKIAELISSLYTS